MQCLNRNLGKSELLTENNLEFILAHISQGNTHSVAMIVFYTKLDFFLWLRYKKYYFEIGFNNMKNHEKDYTVLPFRPSFVTFDMA